VRIGMITSSYPRFEGDIAGVFVRSLAESVAALGHEVHVLAPYDPALNEPSSDVQVHRFRYAVGAKWHLVGYAKSLKSDTELKKSVYLVLPLYLTAACWELWRWHRRVKFDVIHAHWVVPSGPAGALISSLTRTPLVVSLHGSDVFMLEQNVLADLAAHWIFARASRVTACSMDLLKRARHHGLPIVKDELLHSAVNTQRFRPDPEASDSLRAHTGIAPNAPVILALGRLVHKKGFEYLVQAIPDIAARFANVKVIIAGDGPLYGELQRLADELGVGEHLMLVGGVPRGDTVRYINMCDIFVVPSVRDHKGNVDGLPLVVPEAMACGKPLVATRVAGIPEVVIHRENGLLVEEKSPRQLAEAIIELLASPGLAERYGAMNRAKAERELTWNKIAKRMVQVYEQATATRNRG
jgi:glycosyltransferase involved in cell wall biosynthesis